MALVPASSKTALPWLLGYNHMETENVADPSTIARCGGRLDNAA